MTTVVKDGTEQVTDRGRARRYDDGSTAGRAVGRPSPVVTYRSGSASSGCSTALLQLQPYMFTRRFATQVIAPTATGQPGWVSWPVHHGAEVIGIPSRAGRCGCSPSCSSPSGWASSCGGPSGTAAVASVLWALGVWFLGEGLGGLAGGTASLLTGGPGAAVLYAVLALAAWPAGSGTREDDRDDRPEPVASWFPLAWSAIWVDAALMTLLPANRSAAAVRSQLQLVATADARLARAHRSVGDRRGQPPRGCLRGAAGRGPGPRRSRRTRPVAAAALGGRARDRRRPGRLDRGRGLRSVGQQFGHRPEYRPPPGPLRARPHGRHGTGGGRSRRRIASRPDVISTPSGDVRLRPSALPRESRSGARSPARRSPACRGGCRSRRRAGPIRWRTRPRWHGG